MRTEQNERFYALGERLGKKFPDAVIEIEEVGNEKVTTYITIQAPPVTVGIIHYPWAGYSLSKTRDDRADFGTRMVGDSDEDAYQAACKYLCDEC